MPGDVDTDLLRAFVDGDREAFEALYRKYHREVFGWIVRIVRDRTAAEDALIEAFWRAYRSRAQFDAARPFGPWMRRIATNAALDQLRVLGARPTQLDGHDVAASRGTVDVQRHVEDALRALSPKLRVVATLALVEELPLAEIADAVGAPIGTVKSRLFRATRALRERLSSLGIQP